MKMSTPRRSIRVVAASLTFAASFLALPPSLAEEPVSITSPVTDSTGTVNTGEVEPALNKLQDKIGKSLRVVLVDDFDSYGSDSWAKETFRKSGLGKKDTLIAIATDTRQYSIWSGRSGLSRSDMEKAIDSSVTSRWRSGDWQGGIEALVDNLVDAETVDWGGIALATGAVGAGSAAVIGGVVVHRRRKKKKAALAAAEDLEALAKRASAQLVQADDGVRAAAAELEFARADFGVQATQDFEAALAKAQEAIQRAFVIRQELYDDIPETPEQTRRMNEDILKLVETARSSIASQEEGFRKLRDLSSRVGARLDALEERAAEIDSQRDVLVAQIDHLALSHGESAVSTLRTYPEQIATFTDSARSSIASGREQIARGDRNQAIPYMRMAEEAISHASKRVGEIEGARDTLEQGKAKVGMALASISSDVQDAKRLGQGDATIAARQADAERVIALYSGNDVDPIKALSDLAAAEDALDAALAGVRSEEERRSREKAALDRNRSLASSVISKVSDYVGQYSRQVETKTRSLLASARTELAKGDSATSDEQRANHYKSALSRAQEAEAKAHDDVDRAAYTYRSERYDWDESHGRGSDMVKSAVGGMGGMLAGMVLGSLLSGGRSGDGGGFSANAFGDNDFDFGGDFDFDFGGDFDGGGEGFGGSF